MLHWILFYTADCGKRAVIGVRFRFRFSSFSQFWSSKLERIDIKNRTPKATRLRQPAVPSTVSSHSWSSTGFITIKLMSYSKCRFFSDTSGKIDFSALYFAVVNYQGTCSLSWCDRTIEYSCKYMTVCFYYFSRLWNLRRFQQGMCAFFFWFNMALPFLARPL